MSRTVRLCAIYRRDEASAISQHFMDLKITWRWLWISAWDFNGDLTSWEDFSKWIWHLQGNSDLGIFSNFFQFKGIQDISEIFCYKNTDHENQ